MVVNVALVVVVKGAPVVVANVALLIASLFELFKDEEKTTFTHMNRHKIGCNLRVRGIQGCHENARIESFEMSSHLICP